MSVNTPFVPWILRVRASGARAQFFLMSWLDFGELRELLTVRIVKNTSMIVGVGGIRNHDGKPRLLNSYRVLRIPIGKIGEPWGTLGKI